MSSNYNFIFDYQGDDSDWIEIYNNSADTVNLGDCYLSDDTLKPQKWKFPNLELAPNCFLVVFASGKDTVFANGEIHTSFSMAQAGETLTLFRNSVLVNSLNYSFVPTNCSYGRFPDATGTSIIFESATPGQSNLNSVNPKVMFSHRGGIYNSAFSLFLQSNLDSFKIYFTTDGSIPDTTAYLYSEALDLDESFFNQTKLCEINLTNKDSFFIPEQEYSQAIVIRAALFDVLGNRESEVFTNSYFIAEFGTTHLLPVVSICAEYDDLFDFNNGILVRGVNFDAANPDFSGNYYLHGKEWERSVNVEIYDTQNNVLFNQNAGLRTHGGGARLMQQKGLGLYASKEYGNQMFYYQLFEDNEINSHKRIALKPFMSSWSKAGVEDYLANKIAQSLNTDNINSTPCVLYINGHYWGMYFLTEKIDEYFTESNYGSIPEYTEIVETWYGHSSGLISEEFTQMYSFVESQDFHNNQTLEKFSKLVDLNRLVDYVIAQMFLANYDWPSNNMKCWKDNGPNSKWRWIFFDGDACFAQKDLDFFYHISDTSDQAWPVNKRSSLLFRRLFDNKQFQQIVFSRLEYLLSHQLNYNNTSQYLQEIYPLVNSELNNQMNRFDYPSYIDDWIFGMRTIDDFLINRPCILKEQIKKHFGYEINVDKCKNDGLSLETFDVYPNPNNGQFTVRLNADIPAMVIIKITDCFGKTMDLYDGVIYGGFSEMSFECRNFSSGLYMITIFYHNQYFGKQIAIMR